MWLDSEKMASVRVLRKMKHIVGKRYRWMDGRINGGTEGQMDGRMMDGLVNE